MGALYCFLPESREKTLQSSRSASSCRCLGSCKKKAVGDWEHSRSPEEHVGARPGRGLSAHLPRGSAANSHRAVNAPEDGTLLPRQKAPSLSQTGDPRNGSYTLPRQSPKTKNST